MEYITGSRQVTLVDDQDQVLGALDVFAAHEYPTHRHRASSVWLFRLAKNNQLEVLLQKRSEFKPLGAGWWANAICGNVKPEESYLACAHRRLKEEINVDAVQLKPVYKFEYQAYGNDQYGEHEIDQVFIGKYNQTPLPNFQEVSEVGWANWLALQTQVRSLAAGTLLTDPAQTLKYEVRDLCRRTPAVQLTLTLTLAPWTAMMVLDERLASSLHDFFPV